VGGGRGLGAVPRAGPEGLAGASRSEGYNGRVRAMRSRFVVALDASCVAGAAVSRGLGSPRVRSFARVPLRPGALVPSPFEPNLVQADEVKQALARVAEVLEVGRFGVCLVLPDGVARVVLLEAPPEVPPQHFARFRLLPRLPFPEDEAVIDILPVGGGRVLAAAVRRSVVQEYETAAEAAGMVQDRLDLAPLAAVAALAQEPAGPAPTVDLLLGDCAYSLAAYHGGALRVFRSRRRDPAPDEAQRLRQEVERTADLAGAGSAPRLRVVGPGAARLIQEFLSAGTEAEAGWRLSAEELAAESAEMAWLGGALT